MKTNSKTQTNNYEIPSINEREKKLFPGSIYMLTNNKNNNNKKNLIIFLKEKEKGREIFQYYTHAQQYSNHLALRAYIVCVYVLW